MFLPKRLEKKLNNKQQQHVMFSLAKYATDAIKFFQVDLILLFVNCYETLLTFQTIQLKKFDIRPAVVYFDFNVILSSDEIVWNWNLKLLHSYK